MAASLRSRTLTLTLLGAGVVGAAVAAVTLAAAPSATGAPTCTITWTGATSNDWSTSTNWSPARVPASTDVACMAASPTRAAVTLTASTTVRAVVFTPATSSLAISGATLTVTEPAGTADTSSVRNLALSSGTWRGSGAVTGLTSTSGSFRAGVVSLASTSTVNDLHLDEGAAVTNQGSFGWNSGAGFFELYGGSTFTNTAAGTLTLTGNGAYSLYNSGNGNALVNAGTLVVNLATGASPLQIGMPFANTGSVTGTRGTANANGGGVPGTPDSGSYAMASGAVFAFGGGTRTVTTISSTGAGSIGIAGGTTSIAAGSISNLLLTGGSLGAPSGAGFSIGAVNSPGGTSGQLVGPGTTTITGTGTGTATTSVLDHLHLDSGARVVNQGPARWNSSTDFFELYGGSTLTNTGTLTITGNAAYSLYNSGTGNALVNAGTLVVNLDAATTVLQINVPFADTGSVTGTRGTANAAGGGVPGTPDTGSYAMASGAVFAFGGGTRIVTTISSTGAGSVGVAGGATTIAAGSISNVLLTGGSLGAPSGAGFSIGAVNSPGGTSGQLVGPGTITITGTGTGTATTSVLDHLHLDSGARVVNQGAARWNSSTDFFELYGGSVLTNTGTLTITGNAAYPLYNSGTGNSLVNAGSMVLTLDANAAGSSVQQNVPFTNSGTLTATRGTLVLGGGVTNLSGGTLTGGTWNAPSGTITLPDTVSVNAATISIGSSGQILASSTAAPAVAPLYSNSGSLTTARNITLANTSLANTGTITVLAGTLVAPQITQTAGSITVAAGATLNAGSAQVRVNGGILTGSGTVRGAVVGSGTVVPGTAGTGALNVIGTVNTSAGTTLDVTEGPSAGTAVTSGNPVTVTGAKLVITTTGTPATGTVRTVISGSTRTGAVAAVTGVDVPAAGGYWVVGYTPNSVTLTLTAYPAVSVGDAANVVEGNSGFTPATFTVTLAAASPATAVVDYATTPGTATSGVDYAGQTGTLTFLPGETTKTVQVSVVGDTLHENAETFGLTLSNPRGTSLGTATAAATITDDDAAPAFSVSDAQGATSAAGGGTVTFTVALDTPSGLTASVQYATVDGTALAGTDYTATSGTLTIPAGSTSATVDVQLATKTGYAAPKTFTLTLSNPVEATVADGSGTGTGTGTIVNGNPNGPTVAAVVPDRGAQGTAVPVTVNGTGFGAGSTLTISGTGVVVSAVSVTDPTTMTATFTIAAGATVGARNVTVSSGGLSDTCTGCFTVVARPTVTSLDRPNLATATSDAVVTVTGTQFRPGAELKLVKGPRTVVATSTTVNSGTSVTAFLTLPRTTATGPWNVVVVNADGGSGSCANCLTVWAAPTISSVTPATLARGTTTTVTIRGTGFVPGLAVSVPGAQLTDVTVVDATTITVTVRVPATATTGARAVRVVNPAAAGGGIATRATAITFT